MIGWNDIYNVVAAMVPLYVPVILGYASVKWWKMFNPQQCNAINQMTCYFILPFFIFEFTTNMNPYKLNYFFVAGDLISKCFIIVVLFGWTYFFSDGYEWCITSFSMSSISNSLIVGLPLMKAMYGSSGMDLVIQSAVLQLIIYVMILLFMMEVRRAKRDFDSVAAIEMSKIDVEGNICVGETDVSVVRPSVWVLMKTVFVKLATNPTCLSCIGGLIWALLAGRWHLKMPSIIQGCITIMSDAGTGTSMFCLGLSIGLNKKIVACSAKSIAVAMISRFIIGPLTVCLACFALGVHGEVLRIITVQAALPPAVISFVYAKEYGLHAEVTSTAVIFGTVLSLPILIAYFAVLELI